MKNLVLALALVISLSGVANATSATNNSTTTAAAATTSARQLANALELNEAVYLKIRSLEIAKLEALQQGKMEVEAIYEHYTVSLLQLLTPAQQKAYRALTGTQLVQHSAKK